VQRLRNLAVLSRESWCSIKQLLLTSVCDFFICVRWQGSMLVFSGLPDDLHLILIAGNSQQLLADSLETESPS
jgi:hypothetical protein